MIYVAGCDMKERDTNEYGIYERPGPLLDLEIADTIRVSDYGINPSDNEIHASAIQEVIDGAISSGRSTMILFEPGLYKIDSDKVYAFLFEGAHNLIFEGNGADFLITKPGVNLARINQSKRVILRNFSIDYEISNHTQGWVTEVNPEEKWLKVKIDENWPDPDMEHFKIADYKWAFIKDRNDPLSFKEGTEYRLYLNGWEHVEQNTWIYHTRYTSKLKTIEPGDPFVQISRIDGSNISIIRSEDITLHQLRLYESRGAMLSSGHSSRVNYIGIDMAPREGAWLSAGADGSYNACGREGPWVEDCTFNALGDDNLVIKGYRAFVIDVVNDSTFALVHARHRFTDSPGNWWSLEEYEVSGQKWEVAPGDQIEIIDPLKKKVVSKPKVIKTELRSNSVVVTTDQPVTGIRKGVNPDSSLHIVNRSNSLPGFVVKNNKFLNAPRFGLLLKSSDGLIVNNTFENHCEKSIAMVNHCQEFGAHVENILIKGNRFVGAGGWPIGTAETALHSIARQKGIQRNIFSTVAGAFLIPHGQWDVVENESVELSNIHIIENEWYNWRQLSALTIMNARNVTIKNNSFIIEEEFSKKDTLWLDEPSIRVLYSKDVKIGPQEFEGDVFSKGNNIEVIGSENVEMLTKDD